MSKKESSILKQYYKLQLELGKNPSLNDLKKMGVTWNQVKHYFGTMTELHKKASQPDTSISGIIPLPKTSFTKVKKSVKRYIITTAQNNTRLHSGFFKALGQYCDKFKNTEILVLQQLYKNPTSDKVTIKETWEDLPIGHYLTKDVILNKNLVIKGDLRIQATSPNPLTGLETLTGKKSCIVGHGQYRLQSVATPGTKHPKILTTTGSCSVKSNYSKTSIGARAQFHHTVGAIIIELKGDVFHMRQINADKDGSFYDLSFKYTPSTVVSAIPEALVMGDIHAEYIDPTVLSATKRMIKELQPKKLVAHDVLDFQCQSHHNDKNYLMKYLLGKNKQDIVPEAIRQCVDVLEQLHDPKKNELLIVDSNHHDHLMRWINEKNFKNMGSTNARYYVGLMTKLMDSCSLSPSGKIEGPSAFEIALKELFKDSSKTTFVDPNKSYKIKDIDISQHGDKGSNGSRGSAAGFSKLVNKTIVGHSHSISFIYGCMQVGCSAYLARDFMQGYSTQLHSHGLIYPNGKRTFLTIIDGKYKC